MKNIILLIDDNHRLDHVGCFGGHCETPTWDRVAAEGVAFTQMRTTSPVCSPARSSLFTGFHPQQTGITYVLPSWLSELQGDDPVRVNRPILSQYLRRAGYECFYAGKWHIGDRVVKEAFDRSAATDTGCRDYSEWCRQQGLPDGFIFNDPVRSKPFRYREPPHMSQPHCQPLDIPPEKEHNRWMLDHALRLLNERTPGKPLFFTFSTYGIHPPLAIPEPWYSMYDPADIPEPDNWGPAEGEPDFLAGSYFRRLFNHWGRDFGKWRKAKAVSYGYASYIDHLFGLFLERCRELGLLDDALVVMTSDHGDMFGQHGLWQKFCPYEENLRVPLVMRDPSRLPAGTTCPLSVSSVDVPASILAAAGLDPRPLGLEGEDLLPYAAGIRPLPSGRTVFSQHNRPANWHAWHGIEDWRAIIRLPWKYVLHGNGDVELYNLDQDPGERLNQGRAPETDCLRGELRRDLLAWLERTGDGFAKGV